MWYVYVPASSNTTLIDCPSENVPRFKNDQKVCIGWGSDDTFAGTLELFVQVTFVPAFIFIVWGENPFCVTLTFVGSSIITSPEGEAETWGVSAGAVEGVGVTSDTGEGERV